MIKNLPRNPRISLIVGAVLVGLLAAEKGKTKMRSVYFKE